MRFPRFLAPVAIPLVLALRASAESHVIKFVNKCGYGTPTLMYNGKNVLTGDSYTSNGPFSGIAYLQTGGCNTNGENCTLVEMTLINPTCPGCGSSSDISLISPHKYNVETSFSYFSGCDGVGKTCSSPSCTNAAFFGPNDNFVQVACQVNNVNLLISFCADAAQFVPAAATPKLLDSSPTNTPPSSPSLGSQTPGSVPPPTFTGTSSTPGYGTPPATPTPTPMPTNTDWDCGEEPETTPTSMPTPSGPEEDDSGCDEPGETPSSAPNPQPTTPTQTPTQVPTQPINDPDPECDEPGGTTPPATPTIPPLTPTQAPTNNPDPGCDEPGETTPAMTTTPPFTSAPVQTPPGSSPPSPTIRRQCRTRPNGFSVSGSAPTNPAPTTPAYTPMTTPSTTPMTTPSAGTGTPDPCDEPGEPTTPSQSPTAAQRRHYRNRIRY